MNGIICMSQLLSRSVTISEQLRFTRIIQDSGTGLLAVIYHILDLSKIEQGKIRLEPVPFGLQEAMTDALDLLAFQAAEKGLQYSWESDDKVPRKLWGDRTRLWQIFINLVGNAVKAWKQRRHGIILMDGQMPELDGYISKPFLAGEFESMMTRMLERAAAFKGKPTTASE